MFPDFELYRRREEFRSGFFDTYKRFGSLADSGEEQENFVEKIESLEQYTIYETSSDVSFENVVGQDSLTRFDYKKKNRNKRKIWKKA